MIVKSEKRIVCDETAETTTLKQTSQRLGGGERESEQKRAMAKQQRTHFRYIK